MVIAAGGFIGRHIAAYLMTTGGMEVVAAQRDPASAQRRFPGITAIACDMTRDLDSAIWERRLVGIDAVVNCAGVLHSPDAQAVHAEAPRALFAACEKMGVRRVIHISAISVSEEADTEYSRTKLAAERDLAARDLDWAILRPSLVYAEGSFGGTSLMRGLAGLPGVILLPGQGDQLFDPIHVEDLARCVAILLKDETRRKIILEPVGPERLSLRDVILAWRNWLDLPPAPILAIPMPIIRAMSWIADRTGGGPLSSTAVKQLVYGNIGDFETFVAAIGFRPRSLGEKLRRSPSHVQERWQARLYGLRFPARMALASIWLASGILALLAPGESFAGGAIMKYLAWGAALIDIAIGLGLLRRRYPPFFFALQAGLVILYSLGLSLAAPGLWLDPYGGLLKNLAVLVLIAFVAATAEDR